MININKRTKTKSKPKPTLNFKNCSQVSLYTTVVHNTAQNSSEIFRLIIQIIVTALLECCLQKRGEKFAHCTERYISQFIGDTTYGTGGWRRWPRRRRRSLLWSRTTAGTGAASLPTRRPPAPWTYTCNSHARTCNASFTCCVLHIHTYTSAFTVSPFDYWSH